MTVSDQTILDNAKQALSDILAGKTEQWAEGNESAKTLRIKELKDLIAEYEAKIAAGNNPVFKPLVTGRGI